MKLRKTSIVFIFAMLLFTLGNFPASAQEQLSNNEKYTIEDIKLLQDFLLTRPVSKDIKEKNYDINDDGVWDVFDLCLMKRNYLQAQKQHEIYVSTTEEFKSALLSSNAGDTIVLAPGVYESSEYGTKAAIFHSDLSGTKNSPITIKSADPNDPAILKGTDTQKGIVLYITGDYWNISNIICCGAQKGIVLDHSNYSVIHGVEVYQTGQEGIHLRDGSSYCQISDAKVHDTGLAGSYGEAIYIGSAYSTSGYDYQCDHNLVKGCILGPNVTNESIDIKEYTTGNIIEDCIMYGEGITATDSFVDIKGNETIVRNNICYSQDNNVITDAFQLHCQVDGWGNNNMVYDNTVYFSGETEYIVRAWKGTSCTVYHNTRNPVSDGSMYRAYSGSTITISD